MDRNLWNFFKRDWKKLCGWTLLTFSPIIAGVLFIYLYGSSNSSVDWFSTIQGNDYSINVVLLVFILVSYMVLLITFILYLKGIFLEVFLYKGNSRFFKVYNSIALVLNILILIAIVGYIGFIFVCHWVVQSKGFTFHYIIRANTFLSGIIFSLFIIIDCLTVKSEKIKLQETQSSKAEFDKEEKQIRNNIRFSYASTVLINGPVISLIVLADVMAKLLIGNEGFKDFIDKTFYHMLRVPMLREETYNLFIIGMETGLVVSVLLFSQIVFLFLKFWWHYENYLIAENCETGT